MARTSQVTTGTVISSTWANSLITDYMSQTDTTDQDLASDLEIAAGKELRSDTISETTAASGVTIDGVKLKDSVPYCDTIAEKTGSAGVTVDGVKHLDSVVYVDTVSEKTAAAGVTIDGVKLKDSEPYCDVINEKTGAAGVTVDGVKLKDSNIELAAGLLKTTNLAISETGSDYIQITNGAVTANKYLLCARAYLDSGLYSDNISEYNAGSGTTFAKKTGHAVDSQTLGVGVTTIAVTKDVLILTGDGGGNTVATITGGLAGQILTIIFVDALVTITDTDAHTANTIDLAGTATNLTSADDTTLTLRFDGTSWYELCRSVN